MIHPIEDNLLAYVAERASDVDKIQIDTHLYDCLDCAQRVRILLTIKRDFDLIWEEWSAAEHGRLNVRPNYAAMLNLLAGPALEQAKAWLDRIQTEGKVAIQVLLDSGKRIATLAASAMPSGFEFELRPVIAGVGSGEDDLALEKHLHHGSALLASNLTDDAVRELEAAARINPFVAQSAVSVVYRSGKKYAEFTADSRRGTLSVKHWPVAGERRASMAMVLPQMQNDVPRIAELVAIPGEEYLLAQFEDFHSGRFELVLGPS